MEKVLDKLGSDFPELIFSPAKEFYWSPQDKTVYYAVSTQLSDSWTLLHEASHGLLNHQTYTSDFELLRLEIAAWEKAKQLAKKYRIAIDTDHIEDCLDTYRDWLHKRSLCPTCGVKSLQKDERTYGCLNCDTIWHVSNNRFCRPYRSRI